MTTARRDDASTVRIDLRVIPRAPKNAVAGERDGRILVRVTAPPVDRAANEAVIALLAERLNLPRRAIRIVGGETSRNKSVEIEGLDAAAIRTRLLT